MKALFWCVDLQIHTKEQKHLGFYMAMWGLHRLPWQPLNAQQVCALQLWTCSIFFWGAGEGRNRKLMWTCRGSGFSSAAFCVPVWLASSQHGEETQIFSLMFFVFLDGNMLISCWWYAFENTWISIPGVCLKYFKAVKGLSQGSFQIHATSYILYTGGWKCDFWGGESVVYVHVWIVLFMSNFVLSAQMTSASKIL